MNDVAVLNSRYGPLDMGEGLSIGVYEAAGRSVLHKAWARLRLGYRGRGQPFSADIKVEVGTLIPVTSGFLKVTAIKDETVSIARAPELVAGLSAGPGILAFLGGPAEIADIDGGTAVLLEKIDAATHRGSLVAWDRKYGGHEKPEAERLKVAITSTELSVGEALRHGGRAYRVSAIVPPDPARGVVGWVELSSP